MVRQQHLKLVGSSTDKELVALARKLLQYNIEDFIPDALLEEFQTTLNASSYAAIIDSSAVPRYIEVKEGILFLNAYDDLMSLCRFFVYDVGRAA
jgi:hypothetical protein